MQRLVIVPPKHASVSCVESCYDNLEIIDQIPGRMFPQWLYGRVRTFCVMNLLTMYVACFVHPIPM